jgi:hypothetical protein
MGSSLAAALTFNCTIHFIDSLFVSDQRMIQCKLIRKTKYNSGKEMVDHVKLVQKFQLIVGNNYLKASQLAKKNQQS